MSLTYEAIKLIFGAICLFLVFRVANKLLRLAFAKKSRFQMISKTFLFLEILAWALLILSGASALFENNIAYAVIFIVATVLVFLAAIWSVVKDWATGLIIKMEKSFEEGDALAFAEIKGRVKRMGYRCVLLENDKTGTITLPYSLIFRQWMLKTRTTRSEGHKFHIKIDKEAPVSETLRLLRNSALNSPWSSAARFPLVTIAGDGETERLLEIVVYPLEASRAHCIEDQLKKQKYVIN